MVRSVGRGLDPSAGDCPGDGCWRKVSGASGTPPPYGLPGNGRQREPAPHPALRGHLPPRGKARAVIPPGVLAGGFRGVGDAAPYGLPGNGWRREPPPHPALRGHLPPRGKARAVVGGSASLRGASGTPPPTGCPGKGGSGSLPLIRPCGATFPQGGRQGLLLVAAGGRGGVGAPRPTDGDMETLWGLRGHPFPGRRAVGAGHARPGGLRGHPSMVRSVGRGLDPSAGVGGDGSLRGW